MNRLVRLSTVLCIASAGVAHVMAQVQARDNLAPDTPPVVTAPPAATLTQTTCQ